MPKGTSDSFPDGGMPAASPQGRPGGPSGWSGLAAWRRSLLSLTVGREAWLINSLAFFLGRVSLMGELAPFGLAFFAAVAQVSRKQAPGAAVWSLLGLLSVGRYVDTGLDIFAILLYFLLLDKPDGRENRPQMAPLMLFAAVVVAGAPLLLWQAATLYQVLLTLFGALIGIALAYIFMPGVKILVTKRPATSEMTMCLAIVLAASVAGVGQVAVEGLSLRNIAGNFTVMSLALAGGAGLGTSMGVVVGMAVGLADSSAVAQIIFYAIAGLLAGAFRSLGKFAVILGFMLGSMITVLHFSQTGELVTVLVESAAAAVLLLVIPLDWFRRWNVNLQETKNGPGPQEPVIGDTVDKLTSVAEIFGSLAAASATAAVAAGGRIREMETVRMLSAVGGQVCGPCPRRTGCWEHDFARTHQAMLDALAAAEETSLTEDGLPKPLRESCRQKSELAKTINSVAQYNRTCSFWQKKFAATRQTLTEQLQALSGIIGALAGSLGQQPFSTENLAAALTKEAALAGCPVDEIQVNWRKRSITIKAGKSSCQETRECSDIILPLAARLLGRKLTLNAQCAENRPDETCRLVLTVADGYRVQTGTASVAKEPQDICGDTFAILPVGRDKVALILSDGMGSGSQAAGESSITVEYLGKLLSAGFAAEVAVKTVNDMLLLKEPEESFATLDIAMIDTCAGEVEFLKVGSAPSYIKRVHEVATIKSAALPVGILQQLELEPVKWLMAPGDIIVMVSDGIIDSPCRRGDREPWLVNFLRRSATADPQELADQILRQALNLAPYGITDDMTVLVAQVTPRPGSEQ
ncbi:MAG: stage II sporulation protein E [Negativicutes bacterium]|nr:stage II sporulation protein E [Negativicutes bacterium]